MKLYSYFVRPGFVLMRLSKECGFGRIFFRNPVFLDSAHCVHMYIIDEDCPVLAREVMMAIQPNAH